MKLWAALYGMIWLVLIESLLGMMPNPATWVSYLHLVLGVGLAGFAYSNRATLRETRAPARIKRIAGATFGFTVFIAFLGFLLWFQVGSGWATPVPGYDVYTTLVVFHAISAFAIITQAAAVAIAHDMWEDREFDRETLPGEVPPAVRA